MNYLIANRHPYFQGLAIENTVICGLIISSGDWLNVQVQWPVSGATILFKSLEKGHACI